VRGEPIRVLIVDDQELIRVGFRMVLSAEPGIEVVGEAADGASAVRAVASHRPDVVLMDVRMPGTDGIEATTALASAHPEVRVLILTTFDLDEYALAGLRAGASGFLLKDVRPAELVAAIRTVREGSAVVSPSVTRRLLERVTEAPGGVPPASDAPARGLDPLTERERDVLRLIGLGRTNGEIAAALFLSESTVKTHVGRVLAKLGLRDRVHAVIAAYESGLVPGPDGGASLNA